MTWISVKDRLPEDGQIIVYCCHHPLHSLVGRYCEKEGMPSETYWLPWKRVTHWMPLPELPKEQDV